MRYYRELLTLLSPALRGIVTRHQHSAWIGLVWFFNCDDQEERTMFMTDVGLALSIEARMRAVVGMRRVSASGDDRSVDRLAERRTLS